MTRELKRNWAALTRFAAKEGGASFESLMELDAKLVARGFLPLTPWWQEQLREYYASGKKRFAARVGRAGTKSTVMVLVAMNELLNGSWTVPRGEVHYFAFISETMDEAMARLVQIEERLAALGVAYKRVRSTIRVRSKRLAFRVFPCTVGGVSGPRCIGYVADELSKWRAKDSAANPAKEVTTSATAMTATHPGARELFVSSPWGVEDFHYQTIERGDTERQCVAIATTWVANPTISEQQTHELEENPIAWAREYAAIPAQGLADNWFGEALDAAITDEQPPKHYATMYYIGLDPAFMKDRFGYAVLASHLDPDTERRITWVHMCDSWDPRGVRPSTLARRIREELCEPYETMMVYSDQYEGASFAELCLQEQITLEVVPWVESDGRHGKTTKFKAVKTAMLDGTFKIPRQADLLRELRMVYGIYADGGRERVRWVRDDLGHGDRVSAMVLAGSIALEHAAQDVEIPPLVPGTPEWAALEQWRMRDQRIKAIAAKRLKQSLREQLGWPR